jgi:predicted outer membrane repeat protein
VAAALIALAVPNVASAQIPGLLNVSTTKDGNDNECTQDCTLREAVAVANGQQPILLPAGVYKLTQGPLLFGAEQTTIYGAGFGSQQSSGARTTIIDGNNTSRVAQLGSGANVTLAGVTITGGRAASGAGAFVANGATLFMYNSIVRDNIASSRGGGLHSAGTLEMIQSTISDNRAGVGGGIAVESSGVLYVVAATVTGNTATGGSGGAIAAGGQFHNATLSGGVLGEAGSSGGSFVTNTIFAGPGPACQGNVAATPHTSWSGNLASDTTCAFAAAEGTQGQDPGLGTLRNNRGATDTRALQEGSPAINNADPNFCTGSDQRGAAPVSTCDKGAFEFGGQVPESQLPPPVPGETVNASRARGTVKVKLPGSDEFFVLQDGQQLPMGTTFDTSKGRVNLVAAANNTGKTQKAWFYKGVFKVRQSKGRKPLTTLSMSGKLQCGGGNSANAAAAKRKKRRLWGNGKGRFRTKGKHSAATVVGTIWFVEDRCNGTLTRVKRGKVRVRDFKRGKTVVIKGPRGKYFAKR